MHTDHKLKTSRINSLLLWSSLLLCIGITSWAVVAKSANDSSVPDRVQRLLIKEPITLTKFNLVDSKRQPFGIDQLKGKWSLLFFGYTQCPDVCPATMAELDRAADLLAPKPPLTNNTQYIFVSIDPQRDTPDQLREYLNFFASDFIGITGTESQLKTLTDQLDIKFSKGPGKNDNYAMNHSTTMILVNPQGQYFARLPAPHYAEEVAESISIIQNIGG